MKKYNVIVDDIEFDATVDWDNDFMDDLIVTGVYYKDSPNLYDTMSDKTIYSVYTQICAMLNVKAYT